MGYGKSCDGYIRVGIGTESMDRMKAALRAVKALIEATSSPKSEVEAALRGLRIVGKAAEVEPALEMAGV